MPDLYTEHASPEWLEDEPGIRALLDAFVDLLERTPLAQRQRPPSIKLNAHRLPGLFRHDEDADRTWVLLQSLAGSVWHIRPDKRRAPFDPEYVGARLQLADTGEALCRAWLKRPRQRPYAEEWRQAVAEQAQAFADGGAALAERPLRLAGKSASELVAAFAAIAALRSTPSTLRQLSARCFWGHSKVLDSRQELLASLYPDLQILPRPVLVQAALPETCHGLLFIENQDTYVRALAGYPASVRGLALVYTAGFRGGAERIRHREGASLHYHGGAVGVASFERWWFDECPPPWPLWFWGDLDYAGMAILKSLRRRFGEVRAWEPGYAPLLELLREGGGHAPDTADKSEQTDPQDTGCAYADGELLPAIRDAGRFADQEGMPD